MSQVPTARSWTLRHGEVIYSHIFTTTARKYKTTRIFQQQPQAWFIYRFPGKGQWETIHSMVSQPAAPGKGLDPPRHMLILLLLFMLSISSWGGLVRHPLVMFFFMKCSSISWLVFTLPYYYFHLFIFILVFVCYLFVIVFPGGSAVKHLPAMQRQGFDDWIGKIPWRRKWQPIPVFLPGKSHGQRSLVGNSPWSYKDLDTT